MSDSIVHVSEGFHRFAAQIGSSWNDSQRQTFTNATIQILGRALDGLGKHHETARRGVSVHLVIGQVQSGKTSSFQALMRMARDNAFPLVYLLGGTTRILLGQSVARLRRDFREGRADEESPWDIFALPEADTRRQLTTDAIYQRAKQNLQGWQRDSNSPHRRSTVIASLKNIRISGVKDILGQLGSDYPGLRVLVIDDEADQAGINSRIATEEVSPTHQRIDDLQSLDMDVAYVMYTATPQAPLLSRIGSSLSPDSLTVLEPGDQYCGPQALLEAGDFFVPIAGDDELRPQDSIPDVLRHALNYFVLSLAVLRQDKSTPRLRPVSMLVHPSREMANHVDYANAIQRYLGDGALRGWLGAEDAERQFETRFADAISRLSQNRKTRDVLASKSSADWAEAIFHWLPQIQVALINSDASPNLVEGVSTPKEIDDWDSRFGWILVGGDKLSRGFTVHNLIVTYLARTAAGTDDTNLQRGRFFGYRESYRHVLRGWMSPATHESYVQNAAFHEQMLMALRVISTENTPVAEWLRVINSSPTTLPTRPGAIDPTSFTISRHSGWFFRQANMFAQGPDEYVASRNALEAIMSGFDVSDFQGDNRSISPRKHRTFVAPLNAVYDFLTSLSLVDSDRADLDRGLSVMTSAAVEHQGRLSLRVVLMDDLVERRRDTTSSLFTGSPRTGDGLMRDNDLYTLQIHHVLGPDRQPQSRLCVALHAPHQMNAVVQSAAIQASE